MVCKNFLDFRHSIRTRRIGVDSISTVDMKSTLQLYLVQNPVTSDEIWRRELGKLESANFNRLIINGRNVNKERKSWIV